MYLLLLTDQRCTHTTFINNKYLLYDSFYESEIQIQLDGVRLTQKLLQGCSQGVAGASRLSAWLREILLPSQLAPEDPIPRSFTWLLASLTGYWLKTLVICRNRSLHKIMHNMASCFPHRTGQGRREERENKTEVPLFIMEFWELYSINWSDSLDPANTQEGRGEHTGTWMTGDGNNWEPF